MKHLYEATVTSQGGRNGHIKSDDGILDMKVSLPKSMGGVGGATNPEQLFAAGYSACFENAILHIARMKKIAIAGSKVIATVGLSAGPTGAFALDVKMQVALQGVDRSVTQNLVEEAHKICPYSNATRGNIQVNFEVE